MSDTVDEVWFMTMWFGSLSDLWCWVQTESYVCSFVVWSGVDDPPINLEPS